MWTWFQIKVINKGRGCPGKTVVWGLLRFAFDFYHVWALQTQTGHLPCLFQLFSNEMRILGRKWCQGPQCMAAFKAWELTGYAPLSTSVKDGIILMAWNWSLVGIFIPWEWANAVSFDFLTCLLPNIFHCLRIYHFSSVHQSLKGWGASFRSSQLHLCRFCILLLWVFPLAPSIFHFAISLLSMIMLES